MKYKVQLNSLIFKILFTVAAGILSIAVIISITTINISKKTFSEVYSNSQQHIFEQIYDDLYDFHGEVISVINLIGSNWAYRYYFQDNELSNTELYKTIYYVDKNLKDTISGELEDTTVMILGLNGSSYINRSDKIVYNKSDILDSEITAKALKDKDTILYQYLNSGFTDSTRNTPVIMITKAITDSETGEVFAVVYITIKESDFEKKYQYFTSKINDIYILNNEDQVISSTYKNQLGKYDISISDKKEGEEIIIKQDGSKKTIITQNLQYSHLKIYGVINNNIAVGKMYDISRIILISTLITAMVLIILCIYIRQVTKPLSKLVSKMSSVRKGNFNGYVKIEGAEEIKELSETYNYMLQDLNKYVRELVNIQNEKRKAEIHALQMQINPHYVFNTLASIKWLIWQGDKDKSVKVIDAFILLLRNTISNKNEFITIKDEIINLKNYVLINNTRYGDDISVEYFIMIKCEDYLVPKLILQPFIENAFFHAFPRGQKGEIQVFIYEKEENLCFEIVDDGIGMDEEKIQRIMSKDNQDSSTEHFTGIGVNNVDDRIKLIYGEGYGIDISSKVNEGTKIMIKLPKKLK